MIKINIIKESLYGGFLLFSISYIFYKKIYISFIFFFIGLLFPIINKKNRIKIRKRIMTNSFKDLLNSIHSSLISGKSFRNSLNQSIAEIKSINEYDLLLLDLNKLSSDINLGVSEIVSWKKFSEKIDIEECYEFVDVLEETYLSGGQITTVINRTCLILSEKIDVYLELDLMLAEKRLEFKIMMVAPLVLLWILSSSKDGYMDILYTTLIGRVVMTIVLISMIAAYFIGKKIIDIEM